MSPLLILLFTAGLSSASLASRHSFYRNYTYVEEFNAFYKFHCDNNGGNWSSTYQACEEEGAELFYPKERDEWTVLKKLLEAQHRPASVTNIFVGESGRINVTSSWNSTYGEGRCVTLHTYTGVLSAGECTMEKGIPRSFVCKKDGVESRDISMVVARDVARDVTRDVLARLLCTSTNGYQYFNATGKCYKFHNNSVTWDKANATCLFEGGRLLILESEAEINIIFNKTYIFKDYYIGVRRSSSDSYYYTILGQKLKVPSGINKWDTYGNYDCITIWTGIGFFVASKECSNKLYFICEINV